MTTGGAAGTGGGLEAAGCPAARSPRDCGGKGISICEGGGASFVATVLSSPTYSQAAKPAPARSKGMMTSAATQPRRRFRS